MAATCACPLQVKICDFGLSKYRSSSISQIITKAYTLEYTSPERLRVFTRSVEDDVYAFGILMYFIATSCTPYSNVSAPELKGAVIAGIRPDIQSWAAGSSSSSSSRTAGEQEVVEAYCELAQQCWHPDPGQRPGCPEILSRLSRLQYA
jgi:serine/threonine protein kinase